MSTRSYNSPRRDEAARETRRAIVEAAREQFVRHGYAGTSLAAIARAAGVSLATVKLIAGTKPQLLVLTIQALLRRDGAAVPLAEHPWGAELLAERDPERLLRVVGAFVGAALARQSDLFEVVWQAVPSVPELAALDHRARLSRWDDLRRAVQALANLGALRPDLDAETATDILWALASPQLYRLLIVGRGWSTERWETWLFDSLHCQLLEGRVPQRGRDNREV